MKENFLKVMPWVFSEEGGYVDHPKDPGGATNLGITHRTLSAWRGKKVTKQDVKNLTKKEAQEIYRSEYWNPIRGDQLPSGLDYAVFDYAINSGPARAVKDLQRILGVTQDGIIGAQTLAAIKSQNIETLVNKYMDRRLAFLKSLSGWKTFGKGWSARVSRVRAKSLNLVSGTHTNVPIPDTKPDPEESSNKAREEDTSTETILKKPESWGPLLGGVSGLSAIFTGSGPLQWALAGVIIVSTGFVLYKVIKKEKKG